MPIYDYESFNKNLIPNGYKKDTRELITLAAVLGWKVHMTSGNSITIISPKEEKKYHFGLNGRATMNHNRIRRDVLRFADPERMLLAATAGDIPRNLVGDIAAFLDLGDVADDGTPVGFTRVEVQDSTPEPKPEPKDRPKPKPPVQNSEPVVEKKKVGAHIVSEQPMVAKAHEGRGYESHTTIERRWSDGTVDYKCSECEYTSSVRGGVPGHWAKKHGNGLSPKRPSFKHDVPDARVYAPRQSRIDALAEVLAELLKTGEKDPGTIAREALMWVHEQGKKGTEHAEEREPMSAEEALNRIKALVDNPTERYERERRMRTLEERLALAETQATEATERAAKAEARAERAQQTLRAFTELANDLSKEDATA